MHAIRRWNWMTTVAFAATFALAGPTPARAASPDFDAVQWNALGCPNPDLIRHDAPSSIDFAGSPTPGDEPAYYGFDSTFLYFRYRMDGNPASGGGFAQNAWTALMQVPGADRFKYQYQLSLNGKTDTIEIWRNDPATAQVIAFDPLFNDGSETQLFSTPFDANGMTLARSISDGSDDYFLDFAFPVSELIAAGAIASSADVSQSFFFPATSTNANNYNKGYLNCPFQPYTILNIEKTASPIAVPTNAVTPVTYTIDVHNAMGLAVGLAVTDVAFPAWLSNVNVGVATDDPNATYGVVSTNPLRVEFPTLAANAGATVTITADAMPGCNTPDFMNTATVAAVNAMEKTSSALLDVQNSNGLELCDGMDNDCDGQVDEGDALCDDGNACTTDACTGAGGCSNATIPGCEPCTVPGDCTDDGNACTTATCNAGVCGTDTTPGCEPCAAPGDCADDGNACTTAVCLEGVCGVDATPGCEPCATAEDCTDDGNACTTATCVEGVCGLDTEPACEPCAEPSDCTDDGNACTSPTCQGSVCGVFVIEGCEPCDTPADCTDDGDACTTATCSNGVCGVDIQPGCKPCETAADCNDNHACTTDQCVEGICGNTTIPGCQECTVAADCNDGNACTTELCSDGVCGHLPIDGCIPCTTNADCNDGQACTTDVCGQDGSCQISVIPGCQPCETAADCNDGDACTTDVCSNGTCGHEPIANCPAEVCTDGVDNDGDGQIDCTDPDCEGNEACGLEVCGNCIDDDGDGEVDYEDADCCDSTSNLVIRRMSMRTKPQTGRNQLRLKTQYSARAPEGFDPGLQGTTLQIRDAEGTVLCQRIPFKSDPLWTRMGVFKFRDKTGQMAGGIRKAKFKIQKKKNGRVLFRTNGKKMDYREPVGTEVTVTLAVGNSCTQQSANLRTRKGVRNGRALVFKPVRPR